MKSNLLVAIVLLAISHLVFAGPPMWPKQPKLSAAYESLTVALKQVEKSRTVQPAKHLATASANLLEAKAHLETTKHNKGSAPRLACEQVDLAMAEIKAGRLDNATTHITEAIEQVSRAARIGR